MEFDSCDRITVGAIGDPGNRTFILQLRQADRLVSLVLEKSHVADLGSGGYQLLTEAGYPKLVHLVAATVRAGGREGSSALEADEPLWRISEMELSYDGLLSIVTLRCIEFSEEDPADITIVLTAAQLADLVIEAFSVVSKGRAICPICNLPMDLGGHDCPGANGHHVRVRA
ncbi:MAG: DUF3090 family protein [Actinomycetota bacterium]